jgi:hypothetical protein
MLRVCATSLLCLCLSACSGAPDDSPDLGKVTGKVTRSGTPVINARVYFTPVAGGRTSEGLTGADGSYELVYLRDQKGAAVGEHKVRITTFEEPIVEDNGTKRGGRPEEAPPQFSGGEERRKVEAGEQVIDFTF